MNETPLPKIGDVLNYILLLAHEAATRNEGVKAGPFMVFEVDPAPRRVRVVPMTTQVERYSGTLTVPQDVI